jgi:hypothetical protein
MVTNEQQGDDCKRRREREEKERACFSHIER